MVAASVPRVAAGWREANLGTPNRDTHQIEGVEEELQTETVAFQFELHLYHLEANGLLVLNLSCLDRAFSVEQELE